MEIYNIKDKMNYLKEIITLEHDMWAKDKNNNKEERINKKISKVESMLNLNNFCKLILLQNDILIGFISLFPTDGNEEQELTPWYATMYVKSEYRGLGYSKILNNAILKEAKKRGYKKVYLKTDLNNYYEKFGAKYIKKLNNGEKLYYIEL